MKVLYKTTFFLILTALVSADAFSQSQRAQLADIFPESLGAYTLQSIDHINDVIRLESGYIRGVIPRERACASYFGGLETVQVCATAAGKGFADLTDENLSLSLLTTSSGEMNEYVTSGGFTILEGSMMDLVLQQRTRFASVQLGKHAILSAEQPAGNTDSQLRSMLTDELISQASEILSDYDAEHGKEIWSLLNALPGKAGLHEKTGYFIQSVGGSEPYLSGGAYFGDDPDKTHERIMVLATRQSQSGLQVTLTLPFDTRSDVEDGLVARHTIGGRTVYSGEMRGQVFAVTISSSDDIWVGVFGSAVTYEPQDMREVFAETDFDDLFR